MMTSLPPLTTRVGCGRRISSTTNLRSLPSTSSISIATFVDGRARSVGSWASTITTGAAEPTNGRTFVPPHTTSGAIPAHRRHGSTSICQYLSRDCSYVGSFIEPVTRRDRQTGRARGREQCVVAGRHPALVGQNCARAAPQMGSSQKLRERLHLLERVARQRRPGDPDALPCE